MRERKHLWNWLTATFIGASLMGCSRGPTPPEAQPKPLISSAAVAPNGSLAPLAASAPLDPVAPGAASPSIRANDERWQRAKSEDLADKQALADALGATGLLEALDDGGEMTATALATLPLADDADLALGPLAKRLLAATNDSREPLLSALLGIAGRPARAREFVDPEGAVEAGAAVLAIAKNDSLPREHRALAISAARALAEKKVVDSSQIPTDLDPP
jgi:hypothetical protein